MALLAPFKNKVGLSKPRLKLLLAMFRNIKDFRGKLHDRLLRYVLDGAEDDAALAELAGKPDAAHALSLRCSQQYGMDFTPSWHALFEQAAQWFQQWGTSPYAQGVTQQQMEESLYRQIMSETISAAAEKGILAIAAACCGPSAVAPVRDYLKEWYGYRASQCKALIAMLSCIDHPAAIQYLLSISDRFRTKGIREEAEEYVRLLAQRSSSTWSGTRSCSTRPPPLLSAQRSSLDRRESPNRRWGEPRRRPAIAHLSRCSARHTCSCRRRHFPRARNRTAPA